jgi:hypothetical protein
MGHFLCRKTESQFSHKSFRKKYLACVEFGRENERMKYECDDRTIVNEYDLDALSDDDDFELPGEIAALISQINRRKCRRVRIVQLQDDQFLLRWQERHPEMVSFHELYGEKRKWKQYKEKLPEYQKLEDAMPPRNFELPMSRQEAFALIAACWLPNEFQSDVSALLG